MSIFTKRFGPRSANGHRRTSVIIGTLCGLAVVVGISTCKAEPAASVADIQGRLDDLQLRAENASVQQILDALSRKSKLTYSLPSNTARQVTGRYSGTINQILSRVLDGHDYIIEVSEDGLKISVLSAPSALPRSSPNPTISTHESKQAPAPVTSKATNPAPEQKARPATEQVPSLASFLSDRAVLDSQPSRSP